MKTNATKSSHDLIFNARSSRFDVSLPLLLLFAASILTSAARTQLAACTPPAANPAANKSQPIPLDQVGKVAGKQYQGDGLSVTATAEGARLRCVFQRLEGQVTSEGLWLTSTVEGASGQRFRVVAVVVGRERAEPSTLARSGKVTVADQLARLIRPVLTEEYSVSMDGVRQDFVIAERPTGEGELCVELALSGARAEAAAYGAKLTVERSGRALAYSRLRAADATGRELTGRLEVLSTDRLAVRVADADATYPMRIDPTFSDADWVSLNPGLPGANSRVSAIAEDGNGNVYFGGNFTFIGTVSANCIAKWDGSTWSALGEGIPTSYYCSVVALAVSGTNLYVGGSFNTAGGVEAVNIAKWDGSAWSALGGGIYGWTSDYCVRALAVSGMNVYAGGAISTVGGVPANGIAKWNGSAWSALGSGTGGEVHALAVSGTNLYVGGSFNTAGGVGATNIAKWDGSAWWALGSGMSGGIWGPTVYALAVSGSNLYAGGGFTNAGGVAANCVARWDGSAWSALGSGMSGDYPSVRTLAVSGSNLYAGGSYFSTAGGVLANSIAKWDGSAWSALGGGMVGGCSGVNALAVNGTNLYAGGEFTTAGGVAVNYIAKWDGSAWSALVPGMDGEVYALAVSGSDLYVGGRFAAAGGVTVNHIAKWDGSAWSTLGDGIPVYAVAALAVSGTNLYAGGINGLSIAKWDGRAWSALGTGIYDIVAALAVSGTNLYAGGRFTTAGGVPATNVAKWDGSAWSPLGSGTDGEVYALAVSGSKLYAGGDFTNASGVKVNHVAKWDGSAWSALGQGMDGIVCTLAVSGNDLYAGGDFTTAGGVKANGIAKWNGSAWSPLGQGFYAYSVYALAVSGTNLYAGGSYFDPVGGVAANCVAKWDGSAWSALGSGVSGGGNWGPTVYALAADGSGHLFVGGDFYYAGTNLSPYIAQANIGATPGRFGGLSYSPITGFRCTFSNATVGYPYRIQTSPSLAVGGWADFTNFNYTGPRVITDSSGVPGPKKFYRAVTP
jgi:hypothetical protein